MSTKIRVLILEDRPADAELMIYELKKQQFDPDWRRVDSEADFSAQLEWPPDVVLADYSLPLVDAPRALQILQERNLEIPFIVVSGAIGEDVAVSMMRRGAADYLLKDRMGRLGSAVRHAIDERQLRDDTRIAEEALRTSEIRFHMFMNNNPALACIKDEDGRVLYVNNTSEAVWGLMPGDCLGKKNHDLWPAEVAGNVSTNDATALNGVGASRTVEEVVCRGKNSRQMLSFRFPFSDAGGRKLLGVISIDISEQVRVQSALKAALASKEALLKEVHHRVKNNLQIISSLLSMQAAAIRDPTVANALRENEERVQSMALIHDRLNGDDKPDQLDLRAYIQTLAYDLFHSYGVDLERVRLRLDLETVWLPLSKATPCGLILNEVLTNALKYAFPNGRSGEILVALRRIDDNQIRLTVCDNGVGLPEGFDSGNATSFGLRIVEILRRQLDGTVAHETVSEGQGTFFSLTFPQENCEARNGSRPFAKKPAAENVSGMEQTA